MASENTDRSNGNLRPWKKGQSGNPGGRKKMPDDAKAMLKAATPAAVKLLGRHPEQPGGKDRDPCALR